VEHSAGAIIFRKEPFDVAQGKDGKIYYLLLHYPPVIHRSGKEYWDLSKGHLEPGETEGKTVRREVEEETGLKDVKFISGFRETIKYFFKWEGKNILKFVTFYLVKAKTEKVKISDEHMSYVWLVYEKALEKLTFKNAKEILKKANDHLSKKGL